MNLYGKINNRWRVVHDGKDVCNKKLSLKNWIELFYLRLIRDPYEWIELEIGFIIDKIREGNKNGK